MLPGTSHLDDSYHNCGAPLSPPLTASIRRCRRVAKRFFCPAQFFNLFVALPPSLLSSHKSMKVLERCTCAEGLSMGAWYIAVGRTNCSRLG
jgi:hypothetical protein